MIRPSWRELICAGALCVLLTACGPEKIEVVESVTANVHAHPEMAQNGGQIVEVGDHVAFVEILHDESAGVVRVWVRDESSAAVAPDVAPMLNVPTAPPVQVEGNLEVEAWTFRHDALKGHVDGARLRLVIGGRTYSPELPHAH